MLEELPVTPTPTTTEPRSNPNDTMWSDEHYNKITDKYKGDSKEVAKALWSLQSQFTKTTQELNTLKNAPKKEESAAPHATKDDSKEKPNSNEQKTPAYVDLHNQMYSQIFETGKISEETIKHLEANGLQGADARVMAKAYELAVKETIKEAQTYVQTDVMELKKWAETEGNMTDVELAHVQEALNAGLYGVLKDVERKYKASAKKTVEHGELPSNTNTDGFGSYNDYMTARRDVRYHKDRTYRDSVEGKFRNSDTSSWSKQMFGM